MAIVLGHGGNPLAPLFAKGQQPDGDLFATSSTHNIRIPSLTIGLNGELLCVAELRSSTSDNACYAFGLRISYDNGATWTPIQEIYSSVIGTLPATKLNLGGMSEPDTDGTIYLLFSYDADTATLGTTWDVRWIKSTLDDYTSWSTATSIKSDVMKVDNSTPANLPAAMKNAAFDAPWEYCAISPHRAVRIASGANEGRHVWGMIYRYSNAVDSGQPSRFGAIARETDGSWLVIGGLDDTEAGNRFSNESGLAIDADGNIVADMRHTGEANRYTTVSADDGATWTDMSDSGVDASTVHCSLTANPSNRDEMYWCGVNDSSKRCGTRIKKSTDGGITWSTGTLVHDGNNAYTAIVAIDSANLVCVFESTTNFTDYTVAWQYNRVARLAMADIDAVIPGERPIMHDFNEKSSGAMNVGHSVIDYGGADVRAVGNTAWTYTANGVKTDGSTALILDPARASSALGQAYMPRSGPWSFEIVADFSTLTTTPACIAASASAAAGAGWALYTNASKQAVFSFYDGVGGNPGIVTGTTDISDGVHAIAVQRDTDGGFLRLFVDSIADATAVADVQDASYANATTNATLGAFHGNTSPLPINTEIHRVRWWRKITDQDEIADHLIATPITKQTPAAFMGYEVELPTTAPSGFDSCTFWTYTLADGGLAFSNDGFDGFGPNAMPLAVGEAVMTTYDRIGDAYLRQEANSLYRGLLIDSDATVGKHFRVRFSGAGASPLRSNVSTPVPSWDHIQETATFTIFMLVKFLDETGAAQMLFSNNAGVPGNPGLFVWRDDATNALRMYLTKSGATRLDYTWTANPLSYDGWYVLAFVGNGVGAPVNLRYGAVTVPFTAPTTLLSASSTNVGGTDGSAPATQPLWLGALSTDNNEFSGRIKDLAIFDEALSDAQILDLAQFSLSWEPSPRGGRGLSLGLGFGV